MCIAIAGEIISIDGEVAKVSIRGNTTSVNVGLITPQVGDYVLVHAGCALQIVPQKEAQSLDDMFDELQRIVYGDNKISTTDHPSV